VVSAFHELIVFKIGGEFMDRLHTQNGTNQTRIRVEEVNPEDLPDVQIMRAPYRVDEMGDGDEEVNACRDVIETAVSADYEYTQEDEQAKTNLIILLGEHIEFASTIKSVVKSCGEAGYTLSETYTCARGVVNDLRAQRKKEGMLRVAGGVAAGAVSGVLTGLVCGGPVGAAVGAIVGIGSHFTPWGVLKLFRQVDRDVEVELQGLFGGLYSQTI
jgi:hypothetical protein